MQKSLFVPPVLIAMSLLAAGCTSFESRSEAGSPTAPSAPATVPGGTTTGNLVGSWISPDDLPAVSSCGSFDWEISSQSDSAVAGTFTAECGGGVSLTASVTGSLVNSTTVNLSATGNGFVKGFACPFALTSVATIIDNSNGITMPYTGTTCFGPISGTQTLHKPQPPVPPPPPPPAVPDPAPNAPPPVNPFHVGPGPLTVDRAQQVIFNTYAEFPSLSQVFATDGEALGAADELLLRTIWHLKLAGYDAARQQNPSGAISSDKLTIFIDGAWHAYDIFSLGYAGRATTVQMLEIGSPNPVPNDGIPD